MHRLEITKNYDNVDWEAVIPVLMAYAYVIIGGSNPKMARSREELSYDFAIDTITKYLEDKKKFDPTRNPDLIRYLKYYILRQLVSNSKKKGTFSKEISDAEVEYIDEGLDDYFACEFNLDESIDVNMMVIKIEESIQDEDDLYEIFIGRYYDGAKRSEICRDLKISTAEYDNRIRRLRRRLKSIIFSVS